MSNNNKSNKNAKRSQKGKWGHIGAPPKKTNWPKGPFTMAALVGRNKHQCELSLRNKVDAGLNDGTILELKSKKQPNKAVGRPKSVFVLKANYVASKMELADKTVKTPRKVRKSSATVATVTVNPTPTTPVVSSPAVSVPVTAQPVSAVASAPAPVESSPAPAAPAVSEPTAAPAPVSTPVVG